MPKKESLFINRIKSINYAFRGAILLIKTEASIQIQFVIAILVTIAGFYFNLNTTEWIVQILAICMVMSVEGLNTAIEKIADFIHPEHHTKIGFIKDISAGAVFISAISAIVIGLIIYIPKIF
ncbi:MAG TPA: diacylglycerol kinase family protein [Flavobacteriaceae bacterium]|nr:diacylglycerol kinase family protein [Flavobacteriaceae bacterium]